MTKRIRRWFWEWAHDAAESLWHWIYYKKLLPLKGNPLPPIPNNVSYRFTYSYICGKNAHVVDFTPKPPGEKI